MKRISIGQPTLGAEEAEAVGRVMKSGRLTQGPEVAEFERRFGALLHVEHAVAVSNGTAALHLALIALGIGPGDEVIVPASTFVASVNAIAYTGAKPVIVDVDEDTWCLSPDAVFDALTPRTRAIMPVHVLGASCDMDALGEIASFYHLDVVEDAAEALGTLVSGTKHAGTVGKVGCFSFYGNKTITTGEGGMVITNDADLASRVRLFRGQGQHPHRRYWYIVLGYNYRMTELQAAVGLAQLDRLPDLLARRAAIAGAYHRLLGGVVGFQKMPEGTAHGNWALAVRLPEFASPTVVGAMLDKAGIETRPMFPPVSRMPMYVGSSTPVADTLANHVLMLPMHADLTDGDVERVCAALVNALPEA